MEFNLKYDVVDSEVEEYGGKERVQAMLEDILERYAHPEYFNQEIEL